MIAVSRRPRRRVCRARRGLATLELALALPILLMVMALMVNFGTVASWKVRALNVARYTSWANRPSRSTANLPRPSDWPLTAAIGTSSLLPPTPPADVGGALDGPRVTMLGPTGYVIPNTGDPATDVMNPTLRLLQGNSHLARQFPMLQKLGQYNLDAQTELLENSWDFLRMGLPTNFSFRIPAVYTLFPGLNQEAWAQAYSAAVWAIVKMIFPSYPNTAIPGPLWPLDRDVDFVFYGQIIQPNFPASAPDFQPGLSNFACGDETVARKNVDDLIDRIQGNKSRNIHDVAWMMASGLINLYQRAIQAYQNQGRSPPPQLQQDLNTLTQLLSTL